MFSPIARPVLAKDRATGKDQQPGSTGFEKRTAIQLGFHLHHSCGLTLSKNIMELYFVTCSSPLSLNTSPAVQSSERVSAP